MGMDLVPRIKTVESHHFNWTGWRIITNILEDLDCDMSCFSGSNNGIYVNAATAKQCGKALEYAIKKHMIRVKRIKDKTYYGGYREEFETSDPIETEGDLFIESLGDDMLDKDTKKWFLDAAKFFKSCGGFSQY